MSELVVKIRALISDYCGGTVLGRDDFMAELDDLLDDEMRGAGKQE